MLLLFDVVQDAIPEFGALTPALTGRCSSRDTVRTPWQVSCESTLATRNLKSMVLREFALQRTGWNTRSSNERSTPNRAMVCRLDSDLFGADEHRDKSGGEAPPEPVMDEGS
jgi:hypothetical protein